MSNVTMLTPPLPRLTPQEVQTLFRRAKAIAVGVRVCADHEEEVSGYALETAAEMLEQVDDALAVMASKPSSND